MRNSIINLTSELSALFYTSNKKPNSAESVDLLNCTVSGVFESINSSTTIGTNHGTFPINNKVIPQDLPLPQMTSLGLKNSLNTADNLSKVDFSPVLDVPVSGLFYQDMSNDLSYINTQLIVMLVLASVLYYLSKLLSKKIFNLDKKSAYECGFEPFLILTTFIEVGFILVAFIFLIFDLELIFLSAFLFSSGSIGSFGILIVLLYLLSVWVMVFFEVFSGVLSWPVWSEYAKVYTIWVTFTTVDFLNNIVVGANRWYSFRGFHILPNADHEFTKLGKFDILTHCRYKEFTIDSDFIDSVYRLDYVSKPVFEKKLEIILEYFNSDLVRRMVLSKYGKRDAVFHARFFFNLMEIFHSYETGIATSICMSAPSNSFLEFDDYFYICKKLNMKTFEVAPPLFDYRISLTLTKTKRPHASLGRSFGCYYDCFQPELEREMRNALAAIRLVTDYSDQKELTHAQSRELYKKIHKYEDLAFDQTFLGFWGLYYSVV